MCPSSICYIGVNYLQHWEKWYYRYQRIIKKKLNEPREIGAVFTSLWYWQMIHNLGIDKINFVQFIQSPLSFDPVYPFIELVCAIYRYNTHVRFCFLHDSNNTRNAVLRDHECLWKIDWCTNRRMIHAEITVKNAVASEWKSNSDAFILIGLSGLNWTFHLIDIEHWPSFIQWSNWFDTFISFPAASIKCQRGKKRNGQSWQKCSS